MGKLTGQVALVTAAGRGIGRGIAVALAKAGAKVVVNSYSQNTTEATLELVQAEGVQGLAVVGDITDPDVMLSMRDQALSAFGQIDILVNNVGAGPKDAIVPEDNELGMAAALWDALYGQNFFHRRAQLIRIVF